MTSLHNIFPGSVLIIRLPSALLLSLDCHCVSIYNLNILELPNKYLSNESSLSDAKWEPRLFVTCFLRQNQTVMRAVACRDGGALKKNVARNETLSEKRFGPA